MTYDYDAAGRQTRVTYPDSTYEQTTYDRLDVVQQRDRLGRITRLTYDGSRRVVATTDPAGRTITQAWCSCGSLDALIDANGNRTRWERDVQGRVTREIRADNVTDTLYTYDLAGRLKTTTDPKDQVTTYTYLGDNSLNTTVWTNAQIATPSVSYTYETAYPRVATMVDGIGTTSYTYKPIATLGAGQVATVDGPLTDDTISYTYDELGRVTTRAINGAANTVTWTFDALGRATSEANVLGTFTFAYDGVTNRITSVTYPNNQTSTYSYLPSNQDHRLQTIHHKYPNGSTLSKFDYTYDAADNILTWRQQADAIAVLWKYGYDAADQLTSAVKESTDPTPQVLKRYAYTYDPAGNRAGEQIDDAITLTTHDKLNRLVTQVAGGPMIFAGTVNEPATVTIQGAPATVTATNAFRSTASLTSGTNTVTIQATDPSGNSTTRQWTVDIAGSSVQFTYDPNGNLTSDGTRVFEWNARNQLVTVIVGAQRAEYAYDAVGRRVRTSVVGGSTTSFIWCGAEPCEERNGATAKLVFQRGQQIGTETSFWSDDHLGSVTEIVAASGTLVSRYTYEPFGTVVGATRGFAHHSSDVGNGIDWTWLRSYDPKLGRWLSEDPAAFVDGPNLYSYVRNRPIRFVDLLGLQSVSSNGCPSCTPYLHMDKLRACIVIKHSQPEGVGAVAACTVLSLLAAPSVIGVGAAAGGCAGLSAWYIRKRCGECATFCDEKGPPACPFINQGPETPSSPPGPTVPPPNRGPLLPPPGRR